jgi:hypothetical protein
VHTNNEIQVYSTSNYNIQASGGDTLQFVPRKSSTGTWTSGRIESIASFTPSAGKIMKMESQIRFGTNAQANKQGIWPAFWMMGDSIRHGTGWPQCGELDVMETLNGVLTGYGTAHCGTAPGHPRWLWLHDGGWLRGCLQHMSQTTPRQHSPPCAFAATFDSSANLFPPHFDYGVLWGETACVYVLDWLDWLFFLAYFTSLIPYYFCLPLFFTS